jgi:hypothetical protein
MLVKNMERHHWGQIRGTWDVKSLPILMHRSRQRLFSLFMITRQKNKLGGVHLRLEVLLERTGVFMQMHFLSLIPSAPS